jgi:hypothetical protein
MASESKAVKAVKKFQGTPFNMSCFVCSSKARERLGRG